MKIDMIVKIKNESPQDFFEKLSGLFCYEENNGYSDLKDNTYEYFGEVSKNISDIGDEILDNLCKQCDIISMEIVSVNTNTQHTEHYIYTESEQSTIEGKPIFCENNEERLSQICVNNGIDLCEYQLRDEILLGSYCFTSFNVNNRFDKIGSNGYIDNTLIINL